MPDTFKVQISVPAQGQSLKVVGNGLSSTFPEGREEETDPIQVSFSASYEKIENSIVRFR